VRRLKSLILILCWTCPGFTQAVSPTNSQASTAQPLSLDEAVRIALQQHPALKEAEAAVDAAEADVREARAAYFPQLSLSGIGKVGLSGATGALGLPGFPASPFFRNTAYSVNWYQSVFDFGRIKHLVVMDRALAKNALFRKTSEEQRIVLDVKRAYFAVLEAQRFEQVGQDIVHERSLTVERAKAYYQAELGSKLDLSLAEASLAEAQGTLIHSQNAVLTSLAALRAAMGAQGLQTYALQAPPFESVSLPSLEDLVQEGMKKRPDEGALGAKINALEENFGFARSQSLPEIRGFGAGGQGRFNGTTVKEDQRHGVGALGVIFPIFTGGRLKAERDEARAELAGAMAALDTLHQQIRLEVTKAYYQIAELAERIKAADQQQRAAQEALSLAQARYQVQLGSFLDVLTAQTAAANAEANYARTQFDYERAKAQLDFATGETARP
jgi:outer membrane protein